MATRNKTKETGNKKMIGLVAIIVAAVLLLAVIILIVVESLYKGNYKIINDTGRKISNIEVWLEDDEGFSYVRFAKESIEPGKSVKGNYGVADCMDKDLFMVFYVTFDDGEEMYLYDGSFSGTFDGNIKVRFFEKDGQLKMYARAGVGIFNNTSDTDVDTYFTLDPASGDWDYDY